MQTILLDVKMEGVIGHADPLYIPLVSESDYRPGYVETNTPKLSTDPNVDIYSNLATYPILLDLSGGAWNEFFDIQARMYFEPYHSRPSVSATTTIVQPLLWTLDQNNPVMVGAEHVTTEGASYTFDQYIRVHGKLYALDKTNNKIYKLSGNDGSWSDITPASSGTLTQIFADAKNGTMLLGTSSDKAWRTTSTDPVSGDWSAYTPTASHYVTYQNDMYYVKRAGASSHNNKFALLSRNAATTKKQNPQYIGFAFKNVTNLCWADRWIVVGKPEGIYAFDPGRKQGAQLPLQPFPNSDSDNGQVMFLHGRDVYFSSVDNLFSWNVDSGAVLKRNPARFTGYDNKPFVNGRVLAGISDGAHIYLIYKVPTADSLGNTITDYYLVIGDGENWHPVLAVSYWGSGSDHAAVWYDNDRLRYSMGGKSGYLRTNGDVPIANSAFTVSTTLAPVGITTGWFDGSRDWLMKWFKELRIGMRDRGTVGQVKVYYQVWGEDQDAWTYIGVLTGNQDNASLEFPPGDAGISDVVASKINLRFDLCKSNSSENAVAHYVSGAHLVGMPFYEPAFQCVLIVNFDTEGMSNKNNGRDYSANAIYEALLAAQAQEEPVKLTVPNGDSFFGTVLPATGGYVLQKTDAETGTPTRYSYTIVFREHK